MIETLKVGQLATNCYLFYSPKNGEVFIIDPGDDAGFVMNKVGDLNLKPQAILATHGHFDHILAVTELKLAYDVPFFTHPADSKIINRMERTAEHFTGAKTDPAPRFGKPLRNCQKLKIGKTSLEVIHTPGHTPGSVCFYAKKENVLFSGDTIFASGGYGRTDLPGGDSEELRRSLRTILSLPDDTIIFPGHGEKTSVIEERKFYQFLR